MLVDGVIVDVYIFAGCVSSLLCGMWDLPGPGLEPASPALASRFLTTAPPEKPCPYFIIEEIEAQRETSARLSLSDMCHHRPGAAQLLRPL